MNFVGPPIAPIRQSPGAPRRFGSSSSPSNARYLHHATDATTPCCRKAARTRRHPSAWNSSQAAAAASTRYHRSPSPADGNRSSVGSPSADILRRRTGHGAIHQTFGLDLRYARYKRDKRAAKRNANIVIAPVQALSPLMSHATTAIVNVSCNARFLAVSAHGLTSASWSHR